VLSNFNLQREYSYILLVTNGSPFISCLVAISSGENKLDGYTSRNIGERTDACDMLVCSLAFTCSVALMR